VLKYESDSIWNCSWILIITETHDNLNYNAGRDANWICTIELDIMMY